jgi:hypothetical protein
MASGRKARPPKDCNLIPILKTFLIIRIPPRKEEVLMEYRRYSLEQKIKFLDAYEKTKLITEVSIMVGVPSVSIGWEKKPGYSRITSILCCLLNERVCKISGLSGKYPRKTRPNVYGQLTRVGLLM